MATPEGRPTPRRIRVAGRMLNRLIVRAPWAWPAVRGPMRRFFDRSAPGLGRAHRCRLGGAPGTAGGRAPAREARARAGAGRGHGDRRGSAALGARVSAGKRSRCRHLGGDDSRARRARSASTLPEGSPSGSWTPPGSRMTTTPSTWSRTSTCRRSSPRWLASCALGVRSSLPRAGGRKRPSTPRRRCSTGASPSGASRRRPPGRPFPAPTGWGASLAGG